MCSKTVYLTEKIVVEDKEDKKTFHKTCLRCSHCKVTLSLGNYASMQGVFYCKPHFKQLFATKGNYDEGFGKDKHTKNWTPQAVAAPASFVPVDKDESASSKKETPSSIASKFGKTSLNTEKCEACKKTVYATEKTVIEEKEGKKVYHKTCLKCAHCGVIVTLGNYASMQGIVYCKPHFKQLFAQKGNYDEGFGKEKASSKWEPQAVAAPTTFVPVDKDESHSAKKATPDSVASKFNKGTTTSEKCSGCGKTVYLTERIVVEDKEDKQTFHKTCLRCSHCQVVLTLGNYASMQGVMYCKPHFKQLFAAKGNYDEGFGKEKLTKKWQEKDGEGSGVAEPSAASKQHEEESQIEADRKRVEEEPHHHHDHDHDDHEHHHHHDHDHDHDHDDHEHHHHHDHDHEHDHDHDDHEHHHHHDHDEHEHEHHEHEHTHEDAAEVHHDEEPAVETSEPTEEHSHHHEEDEEHSHHHAEEESAPAEAAEAEEAEEPHHHHEEERSEEVSEERSEEVSDE